MGVYAPSSFQFPRAHARGLIEACYTEPSMVWLKPFPRAHARGLIEALTLCCLRPYLSIFPRAHARGLIEACASMWGARAIRYFRERTLAASLKPGGIHRRWCPVRAFPRAHARGLIEARRPTSVTTWWSAYFRERTLAASLKRAKDLRAGRVWRHFRERTLAASLKQAISGIRKR